MREVAEFLLSSSLAVVIAAPRVLGMHVALPMFSANVVPGRIRTGLALGLSLFIMPAILAQGRTDPSPLFFAGIAAKEFLLGFLLGFPVALFNLAAQTAGDFLSFQSGASMATFFDPASSQETTPLGSLLKRYAEVLFFISGAYLFLLGALFESYNLWPVYSFLPTLDSRGAGYFADLLGKYFAATCMLAFPAIACMFLITLCMALIGRHMPQLNVFFLAMPIQCLATLVILIFTFPIYARLFRSHFAGIEQGFHALGLVLGGR